MAPRNVVIKQIHQNAVDEFHPIITVHSIHESDVNSEDIEFLLRVGAGNSPRSVGIAPAFSKSGGLLAIALSVDHLILIVHFYSPKPENGSRSARDLTGRGLIESDILCSDELHIYAFDLGPIALLLHRNHQLHLTNGVDIQSAFPILSQSPLEAVKFAVGDLVPVNSENISIFFEEMIWDPKQLTDLAQRAWLASYVARLDSVQDFFYKAPKIDTKKFNEQVSLPLLLEILMTHFLHLFSNLLLCRRLLLILSSSIARLPLLLPMIPPQSGTGRRRSSRSHPNVSSLVL